MSQGRLNNKLPTFEEGLDAADKSEDPAQYLRELIANDRRWSFVLGYAMNPKHKMPLPEGNPPYIPSEYPIGLAEVEILHLFEKMGVLYNDVSNSRKKEEIITQWLEKMTPKEAELFVAIKDKNLQGCYKNLTEKVFVDALGWDMTQYQNMKK